MSGAKFISFFASLCAVSLLSVFLFNAAKADDRPGEKLFNNNCASCHRDGKNSIDPKKPVIGSKKLASKSTFKSFIAVKNGLMPPFKALADKDEALAALYEYAKALK